MATANYLDGSQQHLEWVLATDLEMAPPEWGRPLIQGDIRKIAANFDPDMFGALAVWKRPDLPIGKGRYITLDGQHRLAAARLMGYLDQRLPCLIYTDLTTETAAELSLGLQERRNLHALDRHRGALAAHDRRAVDIDKVMRHQELQLVYSSRADARGQVSAIGTVGTVWDRIGAVGLERILTICGNAWDRTAAGYSANILKLVMFVVVAHDGDVNDAYLTDTLGRRSPAQWTAKDRYPPRPLSSAAQDVVVEYNKRVRGGNRLVELTPSQYQAAGRRPPAKTRRGKIEGVRTTKSTSRTRTRGPGRYSRRQQPT
jgi:hypothetical protein